MNEKKNKTKQCNQEHEMINMFIKRQQNKKMQRRYEKNKFMKNTSTKWQTYIWGNCFINYSVQF